VLGIVIAVACADDGAASILGSSDASTTTSTSTTTNSSTSGETTTTTTTADSSTGEPLDPPPACGSHEYAWRALVAGPGEPDHDAVLAAKAAVHDRLHDGLASLPLGLAGDLTIADDDADRAIVAEFLATTGGDFETVTGMSPASLLEFQKATGAFAGVGIAADAYRYGTLRDQGADCDAIDDAHAAVERAMTGLHTAVAVTGDAGMIARAITHRDWPGASATPTVPLFDRAGDPQPPEKTNGTFREDVSGEHPEVVWEDACSRDQIIGWAIAFGAIAEVVDADPTFAAADVQRLREDAAKVARGLMTVRDNGFDLEIWDPDGRPTPNGYLHENNVDGVYVGFLNGQHALMSTGILAGLAYAAQDPEIDAYLVDALVEDRNLMRIAGDALFIDFGAQTNHSNYNMAFDGVHLVTRYLDHAEGREDLALAAARLYRFPDSDYQVAEMGQSLFDLVYAAAIADASAFAATTAEPDEDALGAAIAGLHDFPAPPSWGFEVINCDQAELDAGMCTLADGTEAAVLGPIGHNDALVVDTPVPLAIRPPSNFYWRTNPYQPNGGGPGTGLPSSTDFRFAYWLGRFTRRP
jgi:hypothetical protein